MTDKAADKPKTSQPTDGRTDIRSHRELTLTINYPFAKFKKMIIIVHRTFADVRLKSVTHTNLKCIILHVKIISCFSKHYHHPSE